MSKEIIQFDQAMFETKLDTMVREKVERIVNAMLDLDSDQSIELGLEHGVVELYDFIGHGFRPSFQSRFSCVSD